MEKGIVIVFCLFLASSAFLYFAFGTQSKKKNLGHSAHVKVIAVEGGFGYQITNNEKILIRQEVVPTLSGKKPFVSAVEARLIGELVVQKMTKGQSPVVHREELENLNITLR